MKVTTVLCVDDHDALGGRLAPSLRDAGYDVVGVQGSEAALTELSRRRVDVALIDMRLPAADGLELCREIRRRGPTRVIALSPPTAATDAVAFLDAGADDYVTTPVAAAVLAARIRALLRRVDDQQGGSPLTTSTGR